MVDLSKYTITIGCDDNDQYIGLCEQHPNIRIVEDSYKAAMFELERAIDAVEPKKWTQRYEKHLIDNGWTVNAKGTALIAPVNGTTQEEYK